ncbi:MAG: hypothetical protein SPD11_14285 [Sphaerochaetaceae bacterium]|nr:hypothetical protein [Sphaerochaetaceae bacterium]
MKKRMVLILLVLLPIAVSLFAQGAKPVGESSYTGTILSISDENGIFEFIVQNDSGKVVRFIPSADCETILPLASYRAGDFVEIGDYLMVTDTLATAQSMRWITALVSNEWLKSIALQQSADTVVTQAMIPEITSADVIPAPTVAAGPASATDILADLDLRLVLLFVVGAVVLLAAVLLAVILTVGAKKRKASSEE